MNIVDVIIAEGTAMHDKGEYYQGKCPLHGDTSPSLVVYKANNRFHCFGCGARGDAIDFIRQLKDYSFARAVRYLNISHEISQVLIPYPGLIDSLIDEEQQGVKVKTVYRELLKAMGFLQGEE